MIIDKSEHYHYDIMIEKPDALQKKYMILLMNSDIPISEYADYKKWLRNYLEFCKKYQHADVDSQSLSLFIKKLKEKKQPSSQQSLAVKAIELYYSGIDQKGNGLEVKGVHQEACEDTSVFTSTCGDEPWDTAMKAIENEIKVRHYSKKTLKAYCLWAEKFKYYTKSKLPASITTDDVKAFLTFLAVKKKVSASSQNQAFNALLFFFRHALKKEFGKIEGVVRVKRKPYLPVVLSREEVDRVFKNLYYPYDLVVKLLYGCGMRLSECMKLRIHNFNFDHHVLTIHDGKGKKDRTVPLPEALRDDLQNQVKKVMALHEADLKDGYSGVFMPDRLEKKYKHAPRELNWQWFFPAKKLTFVSDTDEYRRYHLHETHVRKAIKKAVRKSKILKRASAYTFRHSFASHPIAANYDIRTIQELLGHSDVRTTMIYTRTIQSRTIKETKSPLDF